MQLPQNSTLPERQPKPDRADRARSVRHTRTSVALVLALTISLFQATNAKADLVDVDDVLTEINALRTKPKDFAERLRPRLAWFEGNQMNKPGEIGLVTNEGPAAVTEAINFLVAAQPQPALTFSPSLARAAILLADDQSTNGGTGHDGRKGGMKDRITQMTPKAPWTGKIAENVAYGSNEAFEIVAQLVIDDGVKNRGHRTNLFQPLFALVGIAAATHPKYDHLCVMDFAQSFGKVAGADPETEWTKQRLTLTRGGNVIAYLIASGETLVPGSLTTGFVAIRHLNGAGDEYIPYTEGELYLKSIRAK